MFANGIFLHKDTDQLRPLATSAGERFARAAEQACLWLGLLVVHCRSIFTSANISLPLHSFHSGSSENEYCF
jgi:hypothetical protein